MKVKINQNLTPEDNNKAIREHILKRKYAKRIEVYHKWYINQEYNEIDNAINTLQSLIKDNVK